MDQMQRNRVLKNLSKQECIPVGCVPTAVVAATRCQYQGGWANPPPEADPPIWRQIPL